MDIDKFRKRPVLGILRGADTSVIEPIIETAVSAGLAAIEITMNTDNAAKLIRLAKGTARGRIDVGAGTVLSLESMKGAIDAGATFIVMPVLVREVVEACVKERIPVFPGALTPQEVFSAWNCGATMVKVFPASFFGPEYFRELKGPFDKIELLACGGVTPQNITRYFECGASAFAFGASVFSRDRLANKDFEGMGRSIKAYVENLPK